MSAHATLAALCAASLLAGFIDSVVGGGGLVQMPALLALLPGTAVPTILGTNKVASVCGTAVAVLRYSRSVPMPWRALTPAAIAAPIASFVGARVVSTVPSEALRPLVLLLLVGVAVHTFVQKDFGTIHAPRLGRSAEWWASVATGAVLGFYDGFFGPGMGSFLIFAFVGIFGFSFLSASAAAKVVNLGSNFAAAVFFASSGHVLYRYAVPMAVCSVLGSLLGTRLAVAGGVRFVRPLFLLVVCAILAKVGFDTAVQLVDAGAD